MFNFIQKNEWEQEYEVINDSVARPPQSPRNAHLAATPQPPTVTDGPQYWIFPREGKQIFYHCIDRSISIYIFFVHFSEYEMCVLFEHGSDTRLAMTGRRTVPRWAVVYGHVVCRVTSLKLPYVDGPKLCRLFCRSQIFKVFFILASGTEWYKYFYVFPFYVRKEHVRLRRNF